MAIEEGELFECHPEPSGRCCRSSMDRRVSKTVDAVRAAVGDVVIERLIVSEGIAEHEYKRQCGCRTPRWLDRAQPAHPPLSDTRTHAGDPRSRLLRAGRCCARRATFSHGPRRRSVKRRRACVSRRTSPLHCFLSLVGHRAAERAPGPDRGRHRRQRRADREAEELRGTRGTEGWPNRYRPSYRVRPVRMPLQLRLECDVTAIERDRPVAVALLAPVSSER